MGGVRLEHGVVVGRLRRNNLKHIPVFDDFPLLIEPENINSRPVGIARPLLVAVQHDIISLRDHVFEFHALARIFCRHALEMGDEGCFAIPDRRVVLDVLVAGVAFDGLRRAALVEHQVVEGRHRALVAFELVGHMCGLSGVVVSIVWVNCAR